ncbi:MAG TPA: hypothetical protein VKA08_06630 [Balneolales bacterium]|nr:hypothetical protein [Balneolales bacterium]
MKRIIWLSGGILFVTAAFFVPGSTGSVWFSILLGFIAAVVYLVALYTYWFKNIRSKSARIGILTTLLLLTIISAVSSVLNYSSGRSQAAMLATYRKNIEIRCLHSYINEPLLYTLASRYDRDGHAGYRTMAAAFHSKYDSLITTDHEFRYGENGKIYTWKIYVAKAHADSVVLVGESEFLKGSDPAFRNFSGDKGRYQVEGILTPKGVQYERTN